MMTAEGAAPAGGRGGAPPSVNEFQALMDNQMAAFLACSNGIGGVTAESAGKVKEAYEVVGNFVAMATVCKKPSANDLGTVFAPLNGGIKGVTGIRKPKDRKDPANLFLDGINGGMGALGFVAATEKAWEVVDQNIEIYRFVGDKILSQYRKTGPAEYVKWEASYQALLVGLKDFVKKNCPCGLAWQPAHSGKDFSEYVPGEVAAGAGGPGGAPSSGGSAAAGAPAAGGAVAGWEAIQNGSLAEYMALANEVGEEVLEMSTSLTDGFEAVHDLLQKAAVCKKPSDIGAVIGGLQAAIKAGASVRPPKRDSPLDLHCKCLKSCFNGLAFVVSDTKSWETVGAAIEEMEFNGNKLLQQFRKSGPELYVKWHNSLKKCLNEVKDFAKAQAPCGLKWDMMGKDVAEYSAPGGAAKGGASSGGGKGKSMGGGKGKMKSAFQIRCENEGLDPEVEMAKLKAENAKKREEEIARAADRAESGELSASDAMFAEINKLRDGGGSIKDKMGLKKTTKGTAHERKAVNSSTKTKSGGFGNKTKTVRPLFEGYEGSDLLKLAYCCGTRSQKEKKSLEIRELRRDAVLIMECEDVDITIIGVCKNISIAGCKRFNVTLEGSIGQVEVSNCSSGYVTVNGKIFQLTCDKCEGLEVTLTPEAYNAKIVSSMCSSLNIALDNPDKSAEMELLTLAVPTQYETKLEFKGTTVDLVTEAVSHNFG